MSKKIEQEFVCPSCGGRHFGRDTGGDPVKPLPTVRCHDEHRTGCKWVGVWPKQIQIDRSGVGHNWKNIDPQDIPSAVREEIEGEIVDGKKTCDDFVASNGMHYRW